MRFTNARLDARPAIVLDDVSKVTLQSLSLPGSAAAECALRLHDVRGLGMDLCRGGDGGCSFLRVEGGRTADISVGVGNRSTSKEILSVGEDVPKGEIQTLGMKQ